MRFIIAICGIFAAIALHVTPAMASGFSALPGRGAAANARAGMPAKAEFFPLHAARRSPARAKAAQASAANLPQPAVAVSAATPAKPLPHSEAALLLSVFEAHAVQ